MASRNMKKAEVMMYDLSREIDRTILILKDVKKNPGSDECVKTMEHWKELNAEYRGAARMLHAMGLAWDDEKKTIKEEE